MPIRCKKPIKPGDLIKVLPGEERIYDNLSYGDPMIMICSRYGKPDKDWIYVSPGSVFLCLEYNEIESCWNIFWQNRKYKFSKEVISNAPFFEHVSC